MTNDELYQAISRTLTELATSRERSVAVRGVERGSRRFYWKLAFTNLKGNRRVYLPYLLSAPWGLS